MKRQDDRRDSAADADAGDEAPTPLFKIEALAERLDRLVERVESVIGVFDAHAAQIWRLEARVLQLWHEREPGA